MTKNNITNVLISVIGKGRLKKDQTVGYEQTEYVFNPDTNKKYVASKTAFLELHFMNILRK